MKFRIGDKVKFLNEVGGGEITKIMNPATVYVSTEDGFEIPVMITEIILHPSENHSDAMPQAASPAIASTDARMFDEMDRITRLQKFTSLNNLAQGIYLAYIPQDQVWLLKDNIELYLVNFTAFDIAFSLQTASQDNRYQSVEQALLPAFSKRHIASIEREDLENWLAGFVQVLFFKRTDTQAYLPLHSPFKVKVVRFLQKDAFLSNNFLPQKSLVVALGMPVAIEDKEKTLLSKDDLKMEKKQVQCAKVIERESFIKQYAIDRDTAEIDLHIESIVEDISSLNKSQMLEMQLNLFSKCIESALSEGLQKVIFIHGVGNGTLKAEIHKRLKEYPNIHYFDASIQKYGCGATEILIKRS
jgi:hypothetical protein